jgi:hypothetical protein
MVDAPPFRVTTIDGATAPSMMQRAPIVMLAIVGIVVWKP